MLRISPEFFAKGLNVMRAGRSGRSIVVSAAIGLLALGFASSALPVRAAETQVGPPDLTKDPKAGAGGDWNLGPTGMRGWMYVKDNYTVEARQILVIAVRPTTLSWVWAGSFLTEMPGALLAW
jgi:hypothetical protein